MQIGSFTLTRDSVLWTLGMIAAIVLALATLGNGVADYGIPLAAVPFIRLAALIVGVISGKLATSPLPGKEDVATIDPRKLAPAVVLAVALGASMCSVTACAGNKAPTTSPQVVVTLKATEVVHGLDTFRDVAKVVSDAYPTIVTAADFQKILTAHTSIVAVIGATPNGWKATAQAALDQLQKDLSPTALTRLQPYLTLARALVDEFVPASGAQ
jgi:hypothetical protein